MKYALRQPLLAKCARATLGNKLSITARSSPISFLRHETSEFHRVLDKSSLDFTMTPYKNPTEVEMNQVVLPTHTNERKENCLSSGQLLKWMDAVACLSAEKHAGSSCVTASMDGLYFETEIYVGQVVNLSARVNRAFNTSMEVGVSVQVEDLRSGEKKSVCQACFTFVAVDETNHKQQLNPIVPFTVEEKLQYALANERRRMRMQYPVDLKELSLKRDSAVGIEKIDGLETSAVVNSDTAFESVELVLPPHANHHHTAFGGQVMAWMVTACTITAARLCRSDPLLRAVDEVTFRGPIKVGDRVILKTMVNNTFDVHMEVGCRVEAYEIGGDLRHVNSAFLIFVAPDDKGVPKTLPPLRGETEDGKRRVVEAMVRKRLRLDREQIRKSVGPAIAIPWKPRISHLLNYNNIETLVKLYELTSWEQVRSSSGVTAFKRDTDNYLCVKVVFNVQIPPEKAFELLKDESRRNQWDALTIKVEVAEVVDDEDDIIHVVLESKERDAMKPDDLVLLVSRRVPCDKRDYFTIAYRSVKYAMIPPLPEYNRKEHLCSGMLITEIEGEPRKATITYINQTTRELEAYILEDLAGSTEFYAERFKKLETYLLEESTK